MRGHRRRQAGQGARRARGTHCSGGRATAGTQAEPRAASPTRRPQTRRRAGQEPTEAGVGGARRNRGGARRILVARLPGRPGHLPEPSGMEPWKQCAQWLIHCKVLPANHRVTWDSAQVFDLAQTLRDGVLLCQLLNNLRAHSINLKEINLRPQMSQVQEPAGRASPPPATSPINHPANFFV